MRRAWWIALAVLGVGSSAQAQPLDVSDEIDPIRDALTARDDEPMLHRAGEGFAITNGPAFDGALSPVPSPAFLAQCLPTAIGTTTCVAQDPGTIALRRISLVDGAVLDADPFSEPVMGAAWRRPLIAASGDDYLVVLASGELRVWRSTASSSTTELVPTPCPLCFVNAIACAPRGCSALITYAGPDGAASLVRVDVGPVPAIGPPVSITASSRSALIALDDQWLVVPPGDTSIDYYDDALVSLGTTPLPTTTFGCVHDACLVLEDGGTVLRCRSGACTPFATLPTSLVGDGPELTCGTVSCGVVTHVGSHPRLGGISGLDGSVVDLVDPYWSRVADQLEPHVAVTTSGALVAYTDMRGDVPRAAFARIEPGVSSDPTYADFAGASGAATLAAALVPSTLGATMLRLDGSASVAQAWVRISGLGALIDQRLDPFTCRGLLAAGPHGLAMACTGAIGPASLVRVSDEGRPIGATRALPIGPPVALALGDEHSLVIDAAGHAVLVDERDGTPGPVLDLTTRLGSNTMVAAAGGGHFLVVALTGDAVGGAMLDDAGNIAPLAAHLRPPGEASIWGARVVYDGSTFVVVWLETPDADPTQRLMLRRVRADRLMEPDTHLLAMTGQPSGFYADRVAIATGGAGWSAVAFVRTEPSPDGAYESSTVHAVELRTLTPIGAVCTDDAECGSAVCADGVCCAVPCDGPCQACSVAAGARLDGVCAHTCLDAGTRRDAGHERDAAARQDAGVGLRPLDGTCLCSAGRSRGSLSAFGMLALLALARRRR